MAYMLLMAIALAGCSVVQTERDRFTAHLGPLLVSDSASSPGSVAIVSRRVLQGGAWVDLDASDAVSGAGIGYRDRTFVSLPKNCQLVFIVENDAQLTKAVSLTRDLVEEDSLCITEQ